MIKTIIRKFLGIDFTPRKHLYNELNECYFEISKLREEIKEERQLRFLAERKMWDLEERINQLQCYIKDLEEYDNFENESY